MDKNQCQTRKGTHESQKVSKRKSITSRKVLNRFQQQQEAESVIKKVEIIQA